MNDGKFGIPGKVETKGRNNVAASGVNLWGITSNLDKTLLVGDISSCVVVNLDDALQTFNIERDTRWDASCTDALQLEVKKESSLLSKDPVDISILIENNYLTSKLGEDAFSYDFQVSKVVTQDDNAFVIIPFRWDADELDSLLLH